MRQRFPMRGKNFLEASFPRQRFPPVNLYDASWPTRPSVREFASYRPHCDDPGPAPPGGFVPTLVPRRLPAMPAPLDGETLTSWLLHGIQALGVDLQTGTRLFGLGDSAEGQRLDWLMMRITETEAQSIAAATGQPPDHVVRMTLRPLLDRLPASRGKDGRMNQRARWSSLVPRNAAVCPQCLHETDGRTKIVWHMPWYVACLTHHCYLATSCPSCAGLIRLESSSRRRSRQCGNRLEKPVGKSTYCQLPLSSIEPQQLHDDRLLRLQGNLLPFFYSDAAASNGEPSRSIIDLNLLLVIALTYGSADQLSGADTVVRDAFVDFTEKRGPAGLWQTRYRLPASRTVMAAAVKLATPIFFSEHTSETASSLLPQLRPSLRIRDSSQWLSGMMRQASDYLSPLLLEIIPPSSYKMRADHRKRAAALPTPDEKGPLAWLDDLFPDSQGPRHANSQRA
ncbi:TniQ family protein [Kitasatospora sp. NPDC017646]|uniref:TniQ family protein n=1 Tax=Kitasatospora sp. NPDC017646 TaxID=3364024 RepID=UPI0037AFBFFD